MAVESPDQQFTDSPSAHVPTPVLKINAYDRLSSGMIAGVFGLIFLVIAAIIYWADVVPAREEFLVPMEMVELSGGQEDGSPDETLKIESPEEEIPNPSPTEEVLEEQEITEVVDNVVELADQATTQATQVMAQTSEATGTPGSASGTGGAPLGSGKGEGGIPNEQRWFISYSDKSSIEEYAKQLDFFGLEMGALLPSGKLALMTKMSAGSPTVNYKTSGKGETRLYMTWQGGSRKEADEKLFKKGSVDASGAVLFHFYPKDTEQLLLKMEFDYAKKKASEIRRTYFVVVKQGSGYAFVVTRQTYLR